MDFIFYNGFTKVTKTRFFCRHNYCFKECLWLCHPCLAIHFRYVGAYATLVERFIWGMRVTMPLFWASYMYLFEICWWPCYFEWVTFLRYVGDYAALVDIHTVVENVPAYHQTAVQYVCQVLHVKYLLQPVQTNVMIG